MHARRMGDQTDYENGMRDGKIEALEAMQSLQNDRLDSHSLRLISLEKAGYILLGAIAASEFLPLVFEAFRA